MPSRFRVIISEANTAAGRGVGSDVAVLDDAKDIGASEQVNGGGEFFMTLPMNHPQIASVLPWQTHYNVQRWNGASYTTIFRGVVDDYEATRDEVVFFGRDYLSLLGITVSGTSDSYSSQYVGQIVQKQITAARAETNSWVNFIDVGTIENTATTTIALSSFQPRLEFISQLADIAMADTTTRAILQASPRTSTLPTWNFTANQGTDVTDLTLEWGGRYVNDFYYAPGYSTLATQVKAIGQKREGATVLFSTQSTVIATPAVYGHIAMPTLFTDIINQAALDDKTKRAARNAARVGKTVGLGIRVNSLGPWEGYDLGDSVPVIISRGIVNLNALYTIWGVEWIGRKNGSEELILSLLPKDV